MFNLVNKVFGRVESSEILFLKEEDSAETHFSENFAESYFQGDFFYKFIAPGFCRIHFQGGFIRFLE